LTKFLQTLLDGIAVGSLYGLIALGYTMVYGILQFINFAHSDVFMLGAWISYVLAVKLGLAALHGTAAAFAPVLVLVGAMAFCGTLGFVIERGAYRPLRRAPRLNVLITAIGVSLLLENTGQLPSLLGTQPRPMPPLIPNSVLFSVAGVDVLLLDVMIVLTAQALMAGLEWLVHHTKLGLGMRALSFDTRTAALMGVPVDRVISLTFVIGSSLAAAAGLLYGSKYVTLQQPAHPAWILLGLKAFVAAVVGGIGNIRGAMMGGLMIGLLEFFGRAYSGSPQLADVYVFSLLILVLLFKPTGLLGRASVEKV
jgi:branched-chain amino acid transport system permease protein